MWPSRAFVAGRSESSEAGSETHRMGNADVNQFGAGHSIEGIALADDYFELFVKWTPNTVTDNARRWLEQRGFTVTPMKSGVLLLGTINQIENAFSVSLENIKLPVNLPVPAELRDYVDSITIPKPRSYHR